MPAWHIGQHKTRQASQKEHVLSLKRLCQLKLSTRSFAGLIPDQGRSQDFSVGTHSFPSHLFTPPPPKKKKDQSHFRFTCLLFQIACARVLIEYRLTYFSVFFFFEWACASHCIERLNKRYFSVILLVYNHPAILPHPYYSEGNFNILVIGRLDIQIIRNSKHGNATVTQTEFQLT